MILWIHKTNKDLITVPLHNNRRTFKNKIINYNKYNILKY